MTNFLTSSESAVAGEDANAEAIASATRRKNAAYNALVAHFGPEAGDPEAQGQLQANALNAQLAPLKVQGAQQDVDLAAGLNPLKIQGAQQDVNLAAQVNPDTAAQAHQRTQAGALALDQGQRADSRQQSLRVLGYLHDQTSKGVPPQQAFDSIPPETFGALGVDPAHVQPLRDAFSKDPAGFIDHFYSGLQAGDEPKTTGAGTVIQKADGSWATVKTDQHGNAVMTPLEGTPATVVRDQTRAATTAGAAEARANPTGFSFDLAQQGLSSIVPGVRITGGARTPERNAQVGGVPDSMHLGGHAVDFVLPAGVKAADVRASLEAHGYPVTEFIDEPAKNGQGAHVHWGWAGKPPKAAATAGGGATLSPQAVDYAANVYRTKGTIPGLGNGGTALKAQIINRAAELAAAEGKSGEADTLKQQSFKERGVAIAELGQTGATKAGGKVQAGNALISHLGLLNELTDALGNGNVEALNRARNAYKAQFGSSAPTNVDQIGRIAGDELTKFITPNGGGVADRVKAEAAFKTARSPKQLRDAINLSIRAAGGQLHGMRQRYEAIGADKEFDAHLTPEARSAMGVPASAHPSNSADAALLAKYGLH